MTPPLPSADDNTTVYTSGLRLTERRPLEDAERSRLGRRMRNKLIAGSAGILSIPLFLILALVLTERFSATNLPMVLCTFFVFRFGFDGLRTIVSALSLRRDLAAGYLEVYVVPEQEGQPRWVGERLPISGTIWSIDGHSPSKEQTVTAARVAEAPAFAHTAAQWLVPYASNDPGPGLQGWQSNKRPLAPAEVGEVNRHIGELAWSQQALFFYVIEGMIVLTALMTMISPTERGASLGLLLIAIAVAYCSRGIFQRIRLAIRLRQDRTFGHFLILKETPPQGEPEESTPTLEVLPNSRLIWSVNGQPAPWRTGGPL